MDKLRRALSGNDEDDQGIMTDISDVTTLSWSTRIKGFAICFVLGIVLSIMGTICLFFLNYILFAILYTIGNLTAMASTCFLMGPLSQLKRMFAETRLFATIAVFVLMALTLCSALWWNLAALALIFCILQFLALTWYALSYVPFARDAVKSCFESCAS